MSKVSVLHSPCQTPACVFLIVLGHRCSFCTVLLVHNYSSLLVKSFRLKSIWILYIGYYISHIMCIVNRIFSLSVSINNNTYKLYVCHYAWKMLLGAFLFGPPLKKNKYIYIEKVPTGNLSLVCYSVNKYRLILVRKTNIKIYPLDIEGYIFWMFFSCINWFFREEICSPSKKTHFSGLGLFVCLFPFSVKQSLGGKNIL